MECQALGNDKSFSNEETERRRDSALLRALSTPHKRQAEMKVGRPSESVARRGTAVNWRAFCKSEDLKEIASARFARLIALAHVEGLLAPILSGDLETAQRRASELSETLLSQNLVDRHLSESRDSEFSKVDFEQFSEKLYGLLRSSQ